MAQVLAFRLGNELYSLEVEAIQEVVESPALHYVPRAPEALLGAINFHGNILPVLDLGAFLELGDGTRDRRILVLTPERASLALAVTKLEGIVAWEEEAQLPLPEEGQNRYIRKMVGQQERMIHLLDLHRLFADLENLL